MDLQSLVGGDNVAAVGKAAVGSYLAKAASKAGVSLAQVTKVTSTVAAGAGGVAIAGAVLVLVAAAIKAMQKRLSELWANRVQCEGDMAVLLATAGVELGEFPIVPRARARTADNEACYIETVAHTYEVVEGRMSWRACPITCPVVRRWAYPEGAGWQHPAIDPDIGAWLTPWAFPYLVSGDGYLREGWIVFGGEHAIGAEAILAGYYERALAEGLPKEHRAAALASLTRIRGILRSGGYDPDNLDPDTEYWVSGLGASGRNLIEAQAAIARVLVASGITEIDESDGKPDESKGGLGMADAIKGEASGEASEPRGEASDASDASDASGKPRPVQTTRARLALGAVTVGAVALGGAWFYFRRPPSE